MTIANLAKDATYLLTIGKAVANTAANLVADIEDLRARIEKLPPIITDIRIGPAEYHACPKDPAPMTHLAEIVAGGGLVLVENSNKVLYRLVGYDAATDTATVTPFKSEIGRTQVPEASKWVYGFLIYLKFNA